MLTLEHLDAIDLADAARPIYLTIGVFDGLHVGHRALIRFCTEGALKNDGTAVVFTFTEHPLCTLAPPHAPPRLITPRRRRELLEELGVDVLIEIPFTRDFAALLPREFVTEVLVGRCRVDHVTCGRNFRFGHDGKGDVDLLEREGAELGFDVHPIEEIEAGGSAASSTAVRDSLLHGKVERAARDLCRPYELEGRVVEGDRRGRSIGFPTANIVPAPRLLLPGHGVYACRARLGFKPDAPVYAAMTNIGVRPTFDGKRETVETHLLDFEGDLYGREIVVEFHRRLRGEMKFAGIEALRTQLDQDREATRAAMSEIDANPDERNHG